MEEQNNSQEFNLGEGNSDLLDQDLEMPSLEMELPAFDLNLGF